MEQRVRARLPIAGRAKGWLIVRLAHDIDSDVAKSFSVFKPPGVRVLDTGGVPGLSFGSISG